MACAADQILVPNRSRSLVVMLTIWKLLVVKMPDVSQLGPPHALTLLTRIVMSALRRNLWPIRRLQALKIIRHMAISGANRTIILVAKLPPTH